MEWGTLYILILIKKNTTAHIHIILKKEFCGVSTSFKLTGINVLNAKKIIFK